MCADLNNYKTPIFPGVNDTPIAPTATKAGNGSDLIARINGLIDELETLTQNTGNSIDWKTSLPASEDYARIEVYYLNESEKNIYAAIDENSALRFTDIPYIEAFTLGINAQPNSSVNISDLIQQYGVGYYFFVFRATDGNLKSNSSTEITSLTIKGTAKVLEESIHLYIENLQYFVANRITVQPIVVKQVSGNVLITLNYPLPE